MQETELRDAITAVGAGRKDLFITTKIRAGLDFTHGGKMCIGWTADSTFKAVQADLAELNVSQVGPPAPTD